MLPSPKITAALNVLGLTFGQFETMSNEQLHKFRRDLIKACHPDLPANQGKRTDLGAINAAYDYLKSLGSTSFNSAVRSTIAPPWQPDMRTNNNTIRVESYRDINYIKKRCWELSGHSDSVYTLDAFGKTAFEGRTLVYGSPEIYEEMAQAMLVWNANGGTLTATRAVFVSSAAEGNALNLIYADGRSFSKKPIQLHYDAAAGSHYNDKVLQSKMPAILDKVAQMYA
jgi:curved DNA-binding protein CbpA